MESQVTNPYAAPLNTDAAPLDTEVAKDIAVGRRASLMALIAASYVGAFIALALGMTTCWIRGGWISHQLQLPFKYWRLPMYFWFHFEVWCVSALVLSFILLPMYLYLRRSYSALRLMCFVYTISATATIGFEVFKSYEMIEEPTHALIVLLSSLALLLPLCLFRLVSPRTSPKFLA
jgi:hypothetical protein